LFCGRFVATVVFRLAVTVVVAPAARVPDELETVSQLEVLIRLQENEPAVPLVSVNVVLAGSTWRLLAATALNPLAGVMAGCADFREGRGPSATPDAKITADVQAQLDLMADLGPPGSIRVQTFSNVVYLNGLVDGGLAKRTAEAAVRQVAGVQSVVDDIDVAHL